MELRLKWAVVFCLLTSSLFYSLPVSAEAKVKFKKQKIELSYKKQKKILNVEIAESEEQHAHGLMFREKLGKDEGMLFVFQDEQRRDFWMKNTLVNLDIGYFNKDKKLIDIQQMKAVSSILQTDLPSYPSKGPAKYALEMSQGWFNKNKFPVGTTFKLSAGP
ncbi:DUF192 domain-containing protein [bacterium]|nr:DUF192 domain-containing protein [bacterium]